MLGAVAMAAALAALPPPTPATPAEENVEDLGRTRRPDRQLHFFGYFLTRAEMTNVAPENDLFKGQVVGRLFGPNTTNTSKQRSTFIEQRFLPIFIYEPRLLSRRARLRASFELDWTYGDTSNATGANFGGGFNADQVNLQTQNLEIEIDLPRKGWHVDIGLQRLYDTAFNPYTTPVSALFNTGERLAFWGSDAVGATVYGREGDWSFKAGGYQLWENRIQKDDDVWMLEAAADRHIMKTWHVGATARFLRDSSTGEGGIGILGQGPDSQLADYMGTFRFPIPDDVTRWRGQFAWTGLNTAYNADFAAGRWMATGFAVGNFGQVRTKTPEQGWDKLTNVVGLAADARVGFRYGRSTKDHITAELIYASGDDNGLEDGTYSGVVTGNTWGGPGAVFASTGTYLLFPHANVVNRFYAAVLDLSNAGNGVTGGALNARYDIVRNKLSAKLGFGVARSNVQPDGGGNFIGAEYNFNLSWRIMPMLDLDVHAAFLDVGDYFDSPEIVEPEDEMMQMPRPRDPWTAFLTLKWLMF